MAAKLAILGDPSNPGTNPTIKAIEAGALTLGLKPRSMMTQFWMYPERSPRSFASGLMRYSLFRTSSPTRGVCRSSNLR